MSLENSIDNLAQAIQALASAMNPSIIKAPIVGPILTPENTLGLVGQGPDETPKRTRRTKEQIAADEAAKQQPQTPYGAYAAAHAATVKEDAEEAPAITEGDVRTALMKLRDKDGNKDRAVAILKKHTGQEVLPGAPATAYAGIVADCEKAMV